jgi:hypothetical protein
MQQQQVTDTDGGALARQGFPLLFVQAALRDISSAHGYCHLMQHKQQQQLMTDPESGLF